MCYKCFRFLFKIKSRRKKNKKNEILEYTLQVHAHNGSCFDTWIFINNLTYDNRIVNIFKNGKGIIQLKVFNFYIQNNEKQVPKNLHFRCGMTNLNCLLKKLGRTLRLQKELLKTEMNHDEVDGNIYKYKKDEWLVYVRQDVLCTAFSYPDYCKAMEKVPGFSMKVSLTALGLGWKYFDSLRTEEDEPIYTNSNKYMSHIVRRSIKGGKVCAFIQYYESKVCGDILKILSGELKVEGNVYDIIEAFMKYKNDHLKNIKEKYENKFPDYRDIYKE